MKRLPSHSIIKTLSSCLLALCLLSSCGGGNGSTVSDSDNSNNKTLTVEQLLSKAVDDGVNGILVYAQKGDSAATVYHAGVDDRVQ
ncbi:hypothetical protein [Colwellia sp. MEBiC06753]